MVNRKHYLMWIILSLRFLSSKNSERSSDLSANGRKWQKKCDTGNHLRRPDNRQLNTPILQSMLPPPKHPNEKHKTCKFLVLLHLKTLKFVSRYIGKLKIDTHHVSLFPLLIDVLVCTCKNIILSPTTRFTRPESVARFLWDWEPEMMFIFNSLDRFWGTTRTKRSTFPARSFEKSLSRSSDPLQWHCSWKCFYLKIQMIIISLVC